MTTKDIVTTALQGILAKLEKREDVSQKRNKKDDRRIKY
jgi:hypothetical protein